jgi:transposase, IS5 family
MGLLPERPGRGDAVRPPAYTFPCKPTKSGPREARTSEGLDQGDCGSLTGSNVPRRSVATLISDLLDSPELRALCEELEPWTGRRGYGARALIGAALAKSLYQIATWSRTARLISEHEALQDAIGGCPSVYACYRFTEKLRRNRPALDACFQALAASLRQELPEYGRDLAIDASDMPCYANLQRRVSKHGPLRERFSDEDASWGHRSAISTRKGGGFAGFKIHGAICAKTELPVAWKVETARTHEASLADDLLQRVRERGFQPETAAMDLGYDTQPIHDACHAHGCLPVIPLKETTAVKRGEHKPPSCEHGEWVFAGADHKRRLTKWRCPAALKRGQLDLLACSPASVWIKASRLHPLIPRETKRWRDLYRGRGAVERCFGRLKHEAGLAPLRVRGLERVQLHADLCILATLASALARARAVPLAA